MSIAAKLVMCIGLVLFGAWGGIRWHAGQDAIAEQARQVNQRAEERLRRQNANTAAVAFEGDRVRIETEFRDVIKEVDRVVTQVVYRDTVCLPPDGLRVIESAIARAYGDPGEPGNAVPNAAAPK